MTAVPRSAAEILLGFARTLRAAGVSVTADRERFFLEAAATVGLADQAGVYHAGRATMCSTPADLHRYDLVYEAWFSALRAGHHPRTPPPRVVRQAPLGDAEGEGVAEESESVTARASAAEVLRHRDVANLSPAERERLHRLFATLNPRAPRKRSHRHTPAHRGWSTRAAPCATACADSASLARCATAAGPTERDAWSSCSTSPGR